MGCYKDNRTDRDLSGHYKNFPNTNSMETCAEECNNAGIIDYSVKLFDNAKLSRAE